MARLTSLAAVALSVPLCGCVSVTTKITGSTRAGAEQVLLTGTADRAIAAIDFLPLSGRKVFLQADKVSATDSEWLVFGLKRAMARQGVMLVDDKKDAEVIVEAAVAAYATDDVDCRFSLPTGFSMAGLLPIPMGSSSSSSSGSGTSALIRHSTQDSVVKLALFGYDAATRQLAWESATVMESDRLDRRFLGGRNITRNTTLPELQSYPPRAVIR